MALPFPQDPDGDTWYEITIAGVKFRGEVEVDGAKRALRADVRNRRGARGASIATHGRKLAEPKITLRAWTAEQHAQLETIAERAFPSTRTARHDAVAVDYPPLAFHGITQVLVHEVDGPKPLDNGMTEMVLSTYEFHPPPPASAASRRPDPATEPTDDIDPEIGTAYRNNPIPTPPSQGTAPAPPARLGAR